MSDNAQKPVLIICGPTASGKSALALSVAQAFGGVIINADSMQVYRELRVLTARPDGHDEALVPHRLYGIASVADVFSAGRWRDLAIAEIEATHQAGALPIVCGGTGFYLKALTEGLSDIPAIPAEIRARVRSEQQEVGAEAGYRLLASKDPKTAATLDAGDTQRVTRAMEVFEATGRPLADWQSDARQSPDSAWRFTTILFAPPRPDLNTAINLRFRKMIDAGALDEVGKLDGLAGSLPALKAVGVPDLRRLLSGEISEEVAIERAQTATRQFAKRQTTWFKNQIIANLTLNTQYSESLDREIFSFIRKNVLTLSD